MNGIAPARIVLRALAVGAISTALACQPDPVADIAEVVREATEAIVSGDEERFVRAHVQKGDMSPDGESWICTAAGGRVPDEAWNAELRAAFRKARADLARLAGLSANARFREVRGLPTPEDKGPYASEYFGAASAIVEAGGARYSFGYAGGMKAQRGWVLTGDPAVVIAKATE